MTENAKYQWSGVFTTVKNGININENFTFRMETEKELMEAREKILNLHAPATKAFPNDEGPVAHTAEHVQEAPPTCSVHNTPMSWRPPGVSKKSGKKYPGFWACELKDLTGGFCQGKPVGPLGTNSFGNPY